MNGEHPTLCRSVFRNVENILTPELYTKVWIQLINQLEKSKETVAVH